MSPGLQDNGVPLHRGPPEHLGRRNRPMKRAGLGAIFVQVFEILGKNVVEEYSCAKEFETIEIKNKKRMVVLMPVDRFIFSPFFFEKVISIHKSTCSQGLHDHHARCPESGKHAANKTHHQREYHPLINNLKVQREAEGEL